MSKFNVKVGKGKKDAGASGGPEAPRERKVIHPGLDKLTMSGTTRCRKCGFYPEWGAFGKNGTMSVGACQCGLWFMDEKLRIRWIRWSSMPFFEGEDKLYAPER